MTARRLALVESNTTGSGRQFCAAARARGLVPVVLTNEPQRYPYLLADRLDVAIVDTADRDQILAACRWIPGLAGVCSSSEYFCAVAADIAVALGLPAGDPHAMRVSREKDNQRRALAAAGVPVPRFGATQTAAGAATAAAVIGAPVVVKPVTGSGSVGVRLCHDPESARQHAADLLATTVNERGMPVPRRVLVEEYVPGPEFSVEIFDGEVVAVVRKHVGALPHFVETGHDCPAHGRYDGVPEIASKAVDVLGVGWGPSHTEVRLTPRGPVVIEVNPRLAGGMIPTVVRLATGVDLVERTITRAAGLRPAAGKPRGPAAIRFVVAPGEGTVTGIHGLAEARQSPGIEVAEITTAVGAELRLTHSFRDRVGYVIASGRGAGHRAAQAAARIHIDLDPRASETDEDQTVDRAGQR